MSAVVDDFADAIERLDEVLKRPKDSVVRDSAIKRFELCFDLAWKAVKLYAKKEGLECYSPRECFKIAFQLKLVDHDTAWLEMVSDRNQTAHIYREEFAEAVYGRLPEYFKLFKGLLNKLSL